MVSPEERFKLIPAVYAIFIKNDQTLLSRRCNTGFEDGNYGLVSGHFEGLETARQAIIREVKEEAGITIEESALELVLTMHRWSAGHERMDLFFIAKTWEGEIENKEIDKCDDLSWFPLKQLPENTIIYIREVIEAYLSRKNYLEYGWLETK